jgi:hypothetical protein
MNWKLFLQTLAAAAIAGSARAATGYIGAIGPTEKVSWRSVGNSAILGAVVAALAMLTQTAPPQPATPPQS